MENEEKDNKNENLETNEQEADTAPDKETVEIPSSEENETSVAPQPSGSLDEPPKKDASDDTPDESEQISNQQTVAGRGSNRLRNLVFAFLALLLLAAGSLVVWQLVGQEESQNAQTEVVKNEIPLLRISAQEGPLNLFYSGIDNDGANMINNHMYEGLVTYENVNRIVPLLATSWSNPDDETWDFTLKQDVQFHNGNTMTAEDVKASLENAQNVGQGGLGIDLQSVEVLDDNTIRIVTNGPDPLLLGRLVGIWVSDSTEELDGDEVPSGTGPYTVKADTEPGANEMTLAAFENYHDGEVYTKELNIKVMSTTDAVEAFNEGEIDMASTLVSDYEDLDHPDQQLIAIKDFTVAFLSLNGSDDESPLANREVRQAIAMAIDKEDIIERQGVNGEPASQFVTRDIPGFDTDITGYERNTDEAQRLLDEAGYEDGVTLSLSYASDSNDGQFESIQEDLEEVGITVTRDAYGDDHDAFFEHIFGGTGDMIFIAYSPEVLDASDTYGFLFSGEDNILHYRNERVDELLNEAAATLNENERLEILKSVGQELHDDVAGIPLYSRESITAMSKPYHAVRHMPNGGSGFKFNQVYLP